MTAAWWKNSNMKSSAILRERLSGNGWETTVISTKAREITAGAGSSIAAITDGNLVMEAEGNPPCRS
jgi:hypothetical protein